METRDLALDEGVLLLDGKLAHSLRLASSYRVDRLLPVNSPRPQTRTHLCGGQLGVLLVLSVVVFTENNDELVECLVQACFVCTMRICAAVWGCVPKKSLIRE